MATRRTKAEAVRIDPDNLEDVPLGAVADELYRIREERLALDRQVDELKKVESKLRDHIINTLPKSEANGIAGKVVRVTINTKVVPRAKDWDAIYAYVKKNAARGGFALLQRRLNEAAVKEIWESGKKVPGVETFNAVTLSINKL